MIKKIIVSLMVFPLNYAMAVVDEENQKNSICYVKEKSPDLVFGQLPFSCKGRPEIFVARVKEEIKFLSNTDVVKDLENCTKKIFIKSNMVNIARGVWDLRNSEFMSTNAAIASSVSDACKIINENKHSSEHGATSEKIVLKFIHPMDFDGSEIQKGQVISYIQDRVKQDYCKSVDMCQETMLRMMEKKNLEAFKNLTQATNRKILDRAIHDYCSSIDMCSYQMLEMMYNENLRKSKESLSWQ